MAHEQSEATGQTQRLKKTDIQRSDIHPQHAPYMLVLFKRNVFRSFSLVKMKHWEVNQPVYSTALTKPIS